jgi:hypothetical protein
MLDRRIVLAPLFVGWTQVREDPIAADVQAELRACRTLSRSYAHRQTGSIANSTPAPAGSP